MLKNAKIIAFFTLISRLLGYIRDFFIANYFGTSVYTDMFFIVFRMPNSLRRFFGEGALNSSVVPVLSKLDDSKKPKAVWNIVFVFFVILIFVSILGVVFSKALIALFAAGFLHSTQLALMDTMTKMTFPYIFFIGLSVLFMGILNTYNRFAVPAFAPALLNISIITSIVLLYSKLAHPVYALCIGVIIGGILQLAVSFFDFLRLKLPFYFDFRIESTTKEILRLMGMAAVGGGVFQIASMVDAFLASFMPHGSFSYLSYANRLFQLPFAVFSIALAQSSLVDLSKLPKDEILPKSSKLIKFVSIISIAVTLYFLFFGEDVIRLIFQHGKFSDISVKNTYYALSFMIVGFFFYSQTKVLGNVYYAVKDVKTPLKASTIAAVLSIISSVVFGMLFGFLGLASAAAVSGFANMAALVYFINKRMGSLGFFEFVDAHIVLFFVLLLFVSLGIRYFKFGMLVNIGLSVLLYLTLFYPFYRRFRSI